MRDAKFDVNQKNIAVVTIDMHDRPLNVMNDDYVSMIDEVLAKLEAGRETLKGVIITSGKDTFIAGGDVQKILDLRAAGPEAGCAFVDGLKSQLRRFERLGIPVVAALNGTALGGGFELALACHYRIAVDNPKARFGFPEVGLGILPASGGIVRSVRLLGLMNALPLLTEGKQLTPQEALGQGLVDALAVDRDAMMAAAETWILANPTATQPWERKGYSIPGGDMFAAENLPGMSMFPSMIFKKTRGLLPAAERILSTAAESVQTGFDAAMAIETGNFCELLMSPVTENLIRTMFLQMNEISSGASRPEVKDKGKVRKVGVLGAGMMGRGIAFASATCGIEVVLKDISLEVAEKGKGYAADILGKRVTRGSMTQEKVDATLALIHPTVDMADLADCDLIIEAVFEDIPLKKAIISEVEALLKPDAIFATNTSTLPISLLATAAKRPGNFLGLHFFSPVDKMHIVEIISGKETSDSCLARAYDYVQQIKKTPIVVNDHRGFFTSRVFSMYPDEGDRLLKDGVNPVLIENLGKEIGMPVGPLAVQDEVMMDMLLRSHKTNTALDQELGGTYASTYAVCGELCQTMCDNGRPGRAAGRGFYDYAPDGGKALWPGLAELFGGTRDMPLQDIRDRLMFRMVVEALRCLDEGVLDELRDGNIGSILAFGFPVHTGGVFQFVRSYGIDAFKARCKELNAAYGERFNPPEGAFQRLSSDS
ncbi:3-hydroxyacyl-CoA dehydrogenase NAD-binding domain-containing protein [Magnetospirillum sp. 15-1]|uniref:3-hydroxyacyl-CoA dehydrogenase NAD-binding domain-containing protein n=1 Tax=Magnetospirillum sp. 15-1 TaxID=1979370 RepID=UPI000BBC3A90|nr:3-hydroxyacyl-CoA dehydrogenase NAD-binding domain-containing protein [Magnetospirillum sp. 15-1]